MSRTKFFAGFFMVLAGISVWVWMMEALRSMTSETTETSGILVFGFVFLFGYINGSMIYFTVKAVQWVTRGVN